MNFKPKVWYPIALVLTAGNVLGAAFAAGSAEPWHATIHAALTVAFGVWALHLRLTPRESDGQARLGVLEAVGALEGEVSRMRQELSEVQERLDFAERVLAQGPDSRRVGPER